MSDDEFSPEELQALGFKNQQEMEEAYGTADEVLGQKIIDVIHEFSKMSEVESFKAVSLLLQGALGVNYMTFIGLLETRTMCEEHGVAHRIENPEIAWMDGFIVGAAAAKVKWQQ